MREKRLLALLVAVAAAAACAAEPEPYRPLPPLALTDLTVRIGLPKPFSVLHVSDSHVTRIDSRDPAALRDFALKRSRMGRGWGDYYLDEAVALARRERMTVVHTGDLIAFCGEACLEYAGRRLRTDDILACVGNHEYWLGEGLRDVKANRHASRFSETAQELVAGALFNGEAQRIRFE